MDKPILRKSKNSKTRLSQGVINIINKQIEKELYSSHLYHSISVWLNYNGYIQSAPVFEKYGDEEMIHAKKFLNYLLDKDIKPIFPGLQQPPTEYTDLVDVLEKSYIHECFITDSINEVCCVANDEEDYQTAAFLQWFLTEQIEEEAKFRNLLDAWDVLGKTTERGLALNKLDEMVSEG